MRGIFATALSVVTMISLSATVGMAQTSCPPEVASAKAMRDGVLIASSQRVSMAYRAPRCRA